MAIGLVAILPIAEGKAEEFEGVFAALREQVLANEEGCEMYDVYKQDDATYVIMERYKDQDALNAHGGTDYFKAAQPAIGACLGGAPELKVLQSVMV